MLNKDKSCTPKEEQDFYGSQLSGHPSAGNFYRVCPRTHSTTDELGQLQQMEMPRASVEAWIDETHLVTYEENTIALGMHNLYTRDKPEFRVWEARFFVVNCLCNCFIQGTPGDR